MTETPGESAPKTPARRSTARLRIKPRPVERAPRRLSREAIVGIVGIVATLVATVVGSVTTYFVSQNQSSTALVNATVEFRRTQQVKAYAEFLDVFTQWSLAQNDAYTKLDRMVTDVDNGVPTNPVSFQKVAELYNQFTLKVAAVQIVASPATEEAATFMSDLVTSVTSALNIAFLTTSNTLSTSDRDPVMEGKQFIDKSYVQNQLQLVLQKAHFIDSAQADMDVYDRTE